jgi:prolyl-tRNA editing enzyme YbaK/EbsC (Cys-tRNA(Pro) deacylase)
MSIENVKKYLRQWGRDKDIIELEATTATVLEAAEALGVIPARIAKSISLRQGDKAVVVVIAGDMKLDNQKYKEYFRIKARMLSPEEALNSVGHAVGGVCPFALPEGVDVYLDVSMMRFDTVFPACGSSNSAIEMTPVELNVCSKSKAWVDLCKPIE